MYRFRYIPVSKITEFGVVVVVGECPQKVVIDFFWRSVHLYTNVSIEIDEWQKHTL